MVGCHSVVYIAHIFFTRPSIRGYGDSLSWQLWTVLQGMGLEVSLQCADGMPFGHVPESRTAGSCDRPG